MTEVQKITRNPDDSVTEMTWAEGGAANELAVNKTTGMATGQALSQDDFNWAHLAALRWLRAMFSRYPNASEGLYGSWLVTNGVWSDTGVPALDGFLSDAVGIDSLLSDVWLDPATIDTGAVRVQIKVSKAAAHPFPATRDTFVYAPVDMLAPPTVNEGELTFLDVPVGNAAPAAPAGTVLVWRVETDATSIVGQSILIPPFPILRTVGIDMLNAVDIEVETLNVTGDATLGTDAANVQTLHGDVTIGDDETNTQVVNGSVTIGTDATCVNTVNGTTTFNDALTATGLTTLNGAATAGDGTQNTGISALGLLQAMLGVSVAGDGVKGQSTDGGGNAVIGVSLGGAAGVRGIGGPSSTSEAGSFTSGHVGAGALVARTIAGATSLGTAVNAISLGDGVAVTARSSGGDGYALVALADLGATPVRTAMRMAPQQTDPSSATAGDFGFISDRSASGKIRVHASAGFESVHSTPKGRVDSLSVEASGSLAIGATTGNICLVAIDAEVVGDVKVVVIGKVDNGADNTTMNVSIIDVTAAVTINGGGTGISLSALTNAGAGRHQSLVASKRYTLPAAGLRTFAVNIGSSTGTTDYLDVSVQVIGLY